MTSIGTDRLALIQGSNQVYLFDPNRVESTLYTIDVDYFSLRRAFLFLI